MADTHGRHFFCFQIPFPKSEPRIPHDDERFEGAKASLACHVRDSVRVQDPRNEARFAEELGNAELGLRK